MAVSHGTTIGSGMSQGMGVVKAAFITAFAGGLFYYLLHTVFPTVPTDWSRLLTCTVWGVAAALLYRAMVENTGNVEQGFAGVHEVFGAITGLIFTQGEHPLLPGVENVIPVDMRDRPVDPPVFEELAKDKVPVFIDGYAIVRVVDPILYLTSIAEGDAIEVLKKLLDAEIRLFVAQWKRAVDLIAQRELLSRFLKLTGTGDTDYAALEHDLMALTEGPDAPLDPPSVRNIMADAGKFCGSAASWGFFVKEIHMERVDLPPRIKEASTEAAAAKDAMKPFKVKQEAVSEMVEALKAQFPNIPEREIFLAVQQLVGIPVNRNVNEIEFRGINIPPNLSSAFARSVEGLARAFNPKGE